MTRLILAAFVVAVLVASPLAAQSGSTNSHDEILPLIERIETTANTHDTDAFMNRFAHDATLVFCFNGQVIHGFDELREQQLKWRNNGKTDVVYTRAAPDGTKRKGTAALSLVWKKTSTGWQIIYRHESLLLS